MDYQINIENFWKNRAEKRMKEYLETAELPYRKIIIEYLKSFGEIESILEIGCGVGTNLLNIKEKYPEIKLAGIDINAQAINQAKELLPQAELKIGKANKLPFPDKSFDVILTCAVLIYIDIKTIRKTVEEILRIAKKGILMIELDGKSRLGEIEIDYWYRNYVKLFKDYKIKVEKIKLNQLWNSPPWNTKGHIYIAHLR